MKFSCTQENINRGLQLVSHIASKNVNLPILHNILIEATEGGVDLVATNLEIGIRVHVRGKVEEQGAFTVPAGILSNYISLVSAERVDMELTNNELHISAGSQETKLKGESSNEFPLIPEVDHSEKLSLDSTELKQALSQAVISVSHDDSRPELTGVLFAVKESSVVMAATDSYRLSERTITLPQDVGYEKTVIIPAQALSELARMLPESDQTANISFSDSQVSFYTTEFELTSRLIEGAFPDYTQIIPSEHRTRIVVDRNAFIKAVKAASLFSKSGIHDVNLHFSPEKQAVTITTVNSQVGENVSRVEAEISGDSNNTVLNYRYLLEGLSAVQTSKMTIDIVDNATPAVFRPQGNDVSEGTLVYIVMPIKQ